MPVSDRNSSIHLAGAEQAFERKLGLPEALGLSLSIVGPSMAMAFNVSLAVRAAGRAAPLAFAIGTIGLGMVALSFVKFSRRVAHAGSACAYIGHVFGWRLGFLAGWTLLLTYLSYAAGVTVLIGNFLQAAAQNYGLRASGLWFVSSVLGLLLAALCAYRDMRLASRLMLVLEAFSVAAIIFLALVIVGKLAGTEGLSVAPFIPTTETRWSGVGYALVFCVLSFAGFEAAATLGEEIQNPHRNIPIAIMGTCALAGVFYVFVTYAQVVGFGMDATNDLAAASAPLNDLANKYVSLNFATVIDLAAAISAFSCVLGSLSAAARLLFALGRSGLASRIGDVHPVHGTPSTAVILTGLLCLVGAALWAPFAGPANYCADLLTIGSLALVLVYIGVNAANLVDSFRARRVSWSICGVVGAVVLLWSFYNSVYPRPDFPNNLWPYCVVLWVLAGALLPIIRPVRGEKIANSWKPRLLPNS
jgi:amino acid transporter